MRKPKSAYSKAIELLARREHSVRELSFKLQQREYSVKDIEDAIQRLLESKYLDNNRFIGCVIRARISQGVGPIRIKAELSGHDITSIEVERHEEWQKANWSDIALRAKIKRFGQALPLDLKAKAKQLQFLTRRGFTQGQAQTAISSEECPSLFD